MEGGRNYGTMKKYRHQWRRYQAGREGEQQAMKLVWKKQFSRVWSQDPKVFPNTFKRTIRSLGFSSCRNSIKTIYCKRVNTEAKKRT